MIDSSEELRMEIKGLLMDPSSNVPIVILRDESSDLFLPIWIGIFEANAIALRMEGQDAPRPMTHDLLLTAIETLGAEVERVVITDLHQSTYYAVIHLIREEQRWTLDSRPSDAIALALRADKPIFVRRTVLDKAQAASEEGAESNEERLRRILEELDPEDLGKYTM